VINLSVDFCGIKLQNPIVTASGTFAPGSCFYDFSKLGAVTAKGVAIEPWAGNPTPRIAESASGMLNAVGLENPGAKAFIEGELSLFRRGNVKIIANLAGRSIEDYVKVAEMLTAADLDMLELNISCPNIKEGGIGFGTSPKMAAQVTEAVRKVVTKPLIVKLTPNVTDVSEIARAVESAGADAISLINTLGGMRIDVKTRQYILANKMGGLSGPAILPVAIRMVNQVSQAVKVPILGMGGVMTGQDVAEFLMAGATAVAVGTAALVDPTAPIRILQELEDFMKEQNLDDIKQVRMI